jgi:HK97 family phage prohead protease
MPNEMSHTHDQTKQLDQELSLLIAGRTKQFTLMDGEMEIKESPSGDMRMSGYVSTSGADLVNDIVIPEAFDKYLYRYKNNPVYCYNHDHDRPIGKVVNVSRDSRGLYLDDITLTAIPLVKEVIWPLVKDGVLKQQSIGFISLDGEYKNNYYYHKQVYLLESSLVTVACNPEANIDRVKTIPGFENYKNMNDLIRAYDAGKFKLPSEISKSFYMGDNPLADGKDTLGDNQLTTHTQNSTVTPDFTGVKAIHLTDEQKALHDPEGTPISKPNKFHKRYDEIASLIHAAKRITGDKESYMFEIGVPTEKGFKVNFEKTAIAACRIMGAKGVADYTPNEKAGIIDRIHQAYQLVGKQMPTYEGVPLNDLRLDVLMDVKFADVEWKNGEKDILAVSLFDEDLTRVENTLKSYTEKKSALPEAVEQRLKQFYAYISVYGSVRTEEDAKLAGDMLTLIGTEPEEVEEPSGAYTMGADAVNAEEKANADEASQQFFENLRTFMVADGSITTS